VNALTKAGAIGSVLLFTSRRTTAVLDAELALCLMVVVVAAMVVALWVWTLRNPDRTKALETLIDAMRRFAEAVASHRRRTEPERRPKRIRGRRSGGRVREH
jgi:hypothetical protein